MNNKYSSLCERNKKKYEFIAIILVYRNIDDLQECIESMIKNINSIKIIIVNAFYDDESNANVKKIAVKTNCDFLEIENKGYSYGNNRGIQLAVEKYDFEYAIIANPDTVVEKFNMNTINNEDVIAPKIIDASRKNQNPMIVKQNRFAEYLIYKGLKNNIKLLFIIGIVISKLQRNLAINLKKKKIFAAHGSFVFINKKVIDEINPLYDENMFLFAEEGVLACKCERYGFETVYNDEIVINHKEDGSMKLADFSINDELKKANIYFYENYVKKSSD